jgi:indole-3-pyruvate monooxygenase
MQRNRRASRSGSDEPSALIIGAGPAGLAVGACLSRADVPFTILERDEKVGASWRSHYDRLHLHTSRSTSGLPYLPFPRECGRYPSRDQVVDYLETYARTFGLEPRLREEVVSARSADDGWEVETRAATYRAPHLVVASGLNREPVVPSWPGQELFRGRILHSAGYRNGAELGGRRVLVVGFGNSGAEIALDLHEHGVETTVSVRGAVNVIPREIFGIPIVTVAIASGLLPPPVADAVNAPLLRFLVGDLRPHGLQALPYGAMTQIARAGRVPTIDIGTVPLIRQGRIAVRGAVERFVDDGVVFAHGGREAFDAVVLATGFRARLETFLKIDRLFDQHGNPRRGAHPVPAGLHLCGFSVAATGVLREIGREARAIAARIASGRRARERIGPALRRRRPGVPEPQRLERSRTGSAETP